MDQSFTASSNCGKASLSESHWTETYDFRSSANILDLAIFGKFIAILLTNRIKSIGPRTLPWGTLLHRGHSMPNQHTLGQKNPSPSLILMKFGMLIKHPKKIDPYFYFYFFDPRGPRCGSLNFDRNAPTHSGQTLISPLLWDLQTPSLYRIEGIWKIYMGKWKRKYSKHKQQLKSLRQYS